MPFLCSNQNNSPVLSCSANVSSCQTYTIEDFKIKFESDNLHSHLSFLHINCRSLRKHCDDISDLNALLSNQIGLSFIGITETKIKQNKNPGKLDLDGYSFVHNDSPTNNGGVGLYIKNDFTFSINKEYEFNLIGCENLWIEIDLPIERSKSLLISIVYRHPKEQIQPFTDIFSSILNRITLNKQPCLILGDFNIDLLNSSCLSEAYLNMIDSFGITSLINVPTRCTSTSSTAIDHCYTNLTSTPISPFRLLHSLSDHYPIGCCIDYKRRPSIYSQHPVRKTKNINYELLSEDCRRVFSDKPLPKLSANNLNFEFDQFMRSILMLADKHMPFQSLSRRQRKLQLKPWITSGILCSIKHRDRLHKTHFIKGDTQQKQIYKSFANKLSHVKRKAKENYFLQQFHLKKHDSKATWNLINKLIKSKPPKQTDHLLINNKKIDHKSDIVNEFNKFFSRIGHDLSSSTPPSTQSALATCKTNLNSMYLDLATDNEVLHIIKEMKTNKAAGHDTIPPSMIKLTANFIAPCISQFFNSCIDLGIFPNFLKKARVVPVHKGGVRYDLNNYRPISVLPSVNYIFEKLLNNRLIDFLHKHSILSDHWLFGFRQGHETLHAMLDITTKYHEIKDKSQFGIGIFLDLRKAFDTVDHSILLQK